MIEKRPKQPSSDIIHTHFQNDNHINDLLDNTGKHLVALEPNTKLHSVVNLVSEANSSTPFNLLIQLKQNRSWGMNVMND